MARSTKLVGLSFGSELVAAEKNADDVVKAVFVYQALARSLFE